MAIRLRTKKYIFPFPENMHHDYWIVFLLSSLNPFAGYFLTEPLTKYRFHEKQTLGLPKSSFFDNEVFSRLKTIFKSHYQYFNERIDFLTPISEKLETLGIKNDIHLLINDLIDYYLMRNKMYFSGRIKSFLLILKLIKGKYYSKYTYSKKIAITRDLIEKVLLNRKEKAVCQKQ